MYMQVYQVHFTQKIQLNYSNYIMQHTTTIQELSDYASVS